MSFGSALGAGAHPLLRVGDLNQPSKLALEFEAAAETLVLGKNHILDRTGGRGALFLHLGNAATSPRPDKDRDSLKLA